MPFWEIPDVTTKVPSLSDFLDFRCFIGTQKGSQSMKFNVLTKNGAHLSRSIASFSLSTLGRASTRSERTEDDSELHIVSVYEERQNTHTYVPLTMFSSFFIAASPSWSSASAAIAQPLAHSDRRSGRLTNSVNLHAFVDLASVHDSASTGQLEGYVAIVVYDRRSAMLS